MLGGQDRSAVSPSYEKTRLRLRPSLSRAEMQKKLTATNQQVLFPDLPDLRKRGNSKGLFGKKGPKYF